MKTILCVCLIGFYFVDSRLWAQSLEDAKNPMPARVMDDTSESNRGRLAEGSKLAELLRLIKNENEGDGNHRKAIR